MGRMSAADGTVIHGEDLLLMGPLEISRVGVG